jgi:hypothetical protein
LKIRYFRKILNFIKFSAPLNGIHS